MIKKIAILLGFQKQCIVRRSSFVVRRALKGILFGILLVSSIWYLGSAVVEGYVIVTNRADLSYTNIIGVEYYYAASDTVQIWVYAGPTMVIGKTAKNLRSGEEGSNTHPISVVPGDTAELNLSAQNTGDTYAYLITIVDTFPADVGDSTTQKLSYAAGSETCVINGSAMADSISWCTDAGHNWNVWQTYNETISLSIPNTCTGIRWRWNAVVHSDVGTGGDILKSWIRVRYKWFRNNN